MARGFAAGFGVGAVVCGAGLVALSLALPVPRPADGPVAAPVVTGPRVDAIEVPAGSEFARGVDEAPVAPAELAPARGNVVGDAPAVARPRDEAAPRQGGDNDPRPETRVEAPGALVAELPPPDAIDLPAMPALPAPIPVAPPGRVEVPDLDRVPASPTPASPAPVNPGGSDKTPEAASSPAPAPVPAPVADSAPQPTAPQAPAVPARPAPLAAPAPGLDLSTPPSLHELRLLDRN